MAFGEAKQVYCVEKNEIFPSVSFVKERYCSNVWMAIQDSKRTAGGYHWRYATDEDLKKGKEINPDDYPKREKSTRVMNPLNIGDGEAQPMARRGWSNEEIERWKKAKEIADSMTNYLNLLEQIFTSPMSEEDKIENFNVAALYVGKLMVSFCEFCETQEIYVERGVRGGKLKKRTTEENKEDDYEYVEEEGE